MFSCVIPVSAKDAQSQKFQDLIHSIRKQTFPEDEIEILPIMEGDSESAKAAGIKASKGEICVMLCADNYFTDPNLFYEVFLIMSGNLVDCVYERRYAYLETDNSLNRYFSLIGNNDPVPFYLGKCDREPWVKGLYEPRGIPSYGCNGFFVRRSCFQYTNLDDYYPMDAHVDMIENRGMNYKVLEQGTIWHRTSDSLISFLTKRYRYARDLFSDRKNRRWKVIDGREDYWKLALFILSTLTVVPALCLSVRGFMKIKDPAWFWHWPVCLGFLLTYSLLAIRNVLKHGAFFQVRCPSPA